MEIKYNPQIGMEPVYIPEIDRVLTFARDKEQSKFKHEYPELEKIDIISTMHVKPTEKYEWYKTKDNTYYKYKIRKNQTNIWEGVYEDVTDLYDWENVKRHPDKDIIFFKKNDYNKKSINAFRFYEPFTWFFSKPVYHEISMKNGRIFYNNSGDENIIDRICAIEYSANSLIPDENNILFSATYIFVMNMGNDIGELWKFNMNRRTGNKYFFGIQTSALAWLNEKFIGDLEIKYSNFCLLDSILRPYSQPVLIKDMTTIADLLDEDKIYNHLIRRDELKPSYDGKVIFDIINYVSHNRIPFVPVTSGAQIKIQYQ